MMYLVQAQLLVDLPAGMVHRGDVVVAEVMAVVRDRRGAPTVELRATHVGRPAEPPPRARGGEQPPEAPAISVAEAERPTVRAGERPGPLAMPAEVTPDPDARQLPEPARTLKSVTHTLEHDPLEQRFYLVGTPLELGRREYALLDFLARHPRQLFSVGQLAKGAWGDDAVEDDVSAVQSSLHRLRKELGSFARRMIQNRRGEGYSFVPEPPPG